MKKEIAESGIVSIVLIVAVLALVASNVFFWVSLNKVNKALSAQSASVSENTGAIKELRVYFTEEEREIKELNTNEFCTKICRDRKYDGFSEGKLLHSGSFYQYECKCYMVVRSA